jgi:uncharacterized protein (TIGR03790 family)
MRRLRRWVPASWLALVSLAAVDGLGAAPAAAALAPRQVAVVINRADPHSVEIGEHYARRRNIPRANVVTVTMPVGRGEITRQEFEAAKAQMDAHLPAAVQALALAWTTPFRVDCLSITSAFAFGFDPAYCAEGCRPTKQSPYFNSNSTTPFQDFGLRPAMLLAGTTVAGARALIDRGVASDGSFPHGTAYLLSTSDRARNSRASRYPLVDKLGLPLRVEHLQADELRDRQDVLFYFTGIGVVAGLETLRFLPGAIADHLTSSGGVLTGHEQMSALRWIEAGATASYGTVVEPCNFPTKFPFPAVLIARYMIGETLIEAYWKSVAWPGQGVFIGEPLAAPFRSRTR